MVFFGIGFGQNSKLETGFFWVFLFFLVFFWFFGIGLGQHSKLQTGFLVFLVFLAFRINPLIESRINQRSLKEMIMKMNILAFKLGNASSMPLIKHFHKFHSLIFLSIT